MKLLAIDGNSILNRAFYGVKNLTTKDGQFTNAIYGFLNILLKITGDTNPDHIAVAFDVSRKTFRNEMFDQYKANRKGMPEELRSQLPILKELLGYLGYQIVECEGYEADDVLGTLSQACKDSGNECVIATGDRDSLQLVNDKVSVRLATTKAGKPDATVYDENQIINTYGVTPNQLIDVKALMGDASDNIPGVAGIGEKTALSLISKYKTLDEIYENIDQLEVTKSVLTKLQNGKDSAYMSRKLAEICKCAPVNTDITAYKQGEVNKAKAASLLSKLEMHSMLPKFSLDASDVVNSEAVLEENKITLANKNIVEDPERDRVIESLKDSENVYVLFNEYFKAPTKAYITANNIDDIFVLDFKNNLFKDTVKTILTEDFRIRTDNAKGLYHYALDHNFEIINMDIDTTICSYLLKPTSSDYSVLTMASEYGITPIIETDDTTIKSISVMDVLCEKLLADIEKNEQLDLLYQIEMPLSEVLASMEHIGFKVDANGIKEFGVKLENDIGSLQSQIFEHCGYTFNLNSPKQLGEALFEKLELPAKKKTKTGYSTNAEVLESLKPYHPVIGLILEYRQLAKLKSTYVDGLLKVIADDGRIHTSFNQTETRTGRISSTEPNLQNIPIRTELGSNLRKYFIAKEGSVLADADYSQIELRVLAHIADDKNMIEAFLTGADIHTNTASQVFNMPKEMVTPLMRSRAKAVNFGIVYGIGAFSLSNDINVTVKEADSYIKNYLNTYTGVKQFMHDSVAFGKENGYVKTMFNRIRQLPEILSSNKIMVAFGERVAMNMPIQGTAADIIKIAMIRVYNRLKKEQLQSRLILQVHDELIVECEQSEQAVVSAIIKEEMENAVQLKAPLKADVNVGDSWYTAKG